MEKEIDNTTSPSKPNGKFGLGSLSFFKNKYLVTFLLFMVWLLFINEKDLVSGFNKREKLKGLQQSEKHLDAMIKETSYELSQLKTNAQTIEKYAREKYLMKKDNEDLFILSSTGTTK